MTRVGWRRAATFSLLLSTLYFAPPTRAQPATGKNQDWPNVFLDKQGTRYSPLDQINTQNVTKLKIAWVYHTRDMAPMRTIECTPLVIDGVMYITTVNTNCVALDAATGKELWRYDPYTDNARHWLKASGGVNRGVAYWSDGKSGGKRRILLGLTDGRLISLDAKTGTPDPAFGSSGIVDLREGLKDEYGDLSQRPYGPTSAPLVFENLVFLGFSNDETTPSAPGDTRAFDVQTGKEVWRFQPFPAEMNSAPTNGPRVGKIAAAPTPGAGSRSIRKKAFCFSAPAQPPAISTAPTAPATISLPIASWRWMRARESGSGISRRFITIYGITTIPARRLW